MVSDTMYSCPVCQTALPPPAIHGRDRLHGLPGQHDVAICPSCGAGTTLPPVADLATLYPSGYAPYDEPANPLVRLLSRIVRGLQARRARRSLPLAPLLHGPPGRAVDVGCG